MEIVESPKPPRWPPHATATLAGLTLLLVWDAAGLDLALARLAGGPAGFALRDHWIASGLLHDWARRLAWLAGGWLLMGQWRPTGALRRLTRRARLQWLASVAVALLLVNALKSASHTSCPWDLAEFGGAAAAVSHWAWGRADGGPGHCFPAGHAAAGFAFVGGYFALLQVSAPAAFRCLWLALAAGLILGLAQQLRGAHFMSHTLWTAWLCWTSAWLLDRLTNWERLRGSGAPG